MQHLSHPTALLPGPHRAALPTQTGHQRPVPSTGTTRMAQGTHRTSPPDEAGLLFDPCVPTLPQPPGWADKASAVGMALLAGGGLGTGLDVALKALGAGPAALMEMPGAWALLGAALGLGMAGIWIAQAQAAARRGAALARGLDPHALQQAGAAFLFALLERPLHPSTREAGRYQLIWAPRPAGMALIGFHHIPLPLPSGPPPTPRDLLGAGRPGARPWGTVPRLPLVGWEQACPSVSGGAWALDHAHLPPQTSITVHVPLLSNTEDVAAWRERLDAIEARALAVDGCAVSAPSTLPRCF